MVTGKNYNIFGIEFINKFNILINCICSTFIPLTLFSTLIRWQNINTPRITVKVPGMSAPDISIEFKGLVLSKYAYSVNSGVDTVA